jgi:hypothetical protein
VSPVRVKNLQMQVGSYLQIVRDRSIRDRNGHF